MVQMAEGVGRDGQEGGQDAVAGKGYGIEVWERVGAKLAFMLIKKALEGAEPIIPVDEETVIQAAATLLAKTLVMESRNAT